MEFVDKSGQPRSNKDLEEALSQVEKSMAVDVLKIPPNLVVYLITIRAALKELIEIRKML